MKHMDIRTKFTQKALKNSLIELMKTSNIRDIPIKAICANAGVSRSTFYTYYDNQYDLLDDIQNEIISHYQDKFKEYKGNTDQKEAHNRYEKLFNYFAENSDSIQIILSENGDLNFIKKFIEQITVKTQKALMNAHEESSEEKTKRLYSTFLVHGTIALIQDWIKHGMDIPIPKMAKLYTKIVHNMR